MLCLLRRVTLAVCADSWGAPPELIGPERLVRNTAALEIPAQFSGGGVAITV